MKIELKKKTNLTLLKNILIPGPLRKYKVALFIKI